MAQDTQQSAGQGPAAPPRAPLVEATVRLARERFPGAVTEVVDDHGETTIVARPEAIVAICQALRDDVALRYDFLETVTAVDWPEREPRFDIVYQALSLSTGAVIRIKARVGDEDHPEPEIPSITSVWPAANWYEREVYDLFGIRFTGHPDLRRIQMPDDWVGHPLRKDYPLTGIQLPEPHWGGQAPFAEPLPESVGRQTLRAPDRTGDVSSLPVARQVDATSGDE